MARDVLLFDLDGTLVDSAPGITIAVNALRAERGGTPIGVEAVRPLVALGAEQLVEQALGGLALKSSCDVAAFRNHLRRIVPDRADIYAGVEAMLAKARSSGWTLAIVTNKPEHLARILMDGLDLSAHFSAIVGGDSASMSKPDPEPIYLALRLLGMSPDRAVFIGDSVVDARAASNAGVPFMLFLAGYGAEDCAEQPVVARFSDHRELPALIASFS